MDAGAGDVGQGSKLEMKSCRFWRLRTRNLVSQFTSFSRNLIGPTSLILSLSRVINVKFPLQPHQKYNITQYGQLTQMKDNYTYQFSLHHLYIFSLKGWENVGFELGNERVNYVFSFDLVANLATA